MTGPILCLLHKTMSLCLTRVRVAWGHTRSCESVLAIIISYFWLKRVHLITGHQGFPVFKYSINNQKKTWRAEQWVRQRHWFGRLFLVKEGDVDKATGPSGRGPAVSRGLKGFTEGQTIIWLAWVKAEKHSICLIRPQLRDSNQTTLSSTSETV